MPSAAFRWALDARLRHPVRVVPTLTRTGNGGASIVLATTWPGFRRPSYAHGTSWSGRACPRRLPRCPVRRAVPPPAPVAVPLPLSEHGRLSEPVAGPAELDEPAVVHGVVDNRRRELVVGVDGAPLLRRHAAELVGIDLARCRDGQPVAARRVQVARRGRPSQDPLGPRLPLPLAGMDKDMR